MTAAALSCAVTANPCIFENEPLCTTNYSTLGYVVVEGSLLPLLFLILFPLVSLTARQMLQMGRGLNDSCDGLLHSLINMCN